MRKKSAARRKTPTDASGTAPNLTNPDTHTTENTATIQALRAATGIADDRLLEELRDLGFTRETAQLLHLVPLVQVAWSAGSVTNRERRLITDLAELRGIRYGTPAFETLREWLSTRPPEHLFRGALSVIRASLDEAPARVRERTIRTLIFHCTQVATASRETAEQSGTISDDEHEALQTILVTLEGEPAEHTARL